MVLINNLYNDFVTLVNQNFYTKTEIDGKQGVINITTGFNTFLGSEYNVVNINSKLYLEISDDLNESLESLLGEYVSDESLSNGLYFVLYSNLCSDYILGVILAEDNVLILNNPEYLIEYDSDADLKNLLISNLTSKGVTVDNSMSLTVLANKILEITPSIEGIDVVTNLSLNLSETNIVYGSSIVVSGVLEADKDDTSNTNVDLEGYLKGATIKIYHDETLIGTAITNGVGEYSFNYDNITIAGTNNIYCVFEGTDYYETCTSENMSLIVGHNISLASNKQILSYVDSDDCTIIATYTGGSGATVQLYDEHDKLVTTMTDEGDGTYTYEYISQGYGDRTFYAKTENLISETYPITDAWKHISSGSYTGTSAISLQELYESSAYDNIEISATIKAPDKGFSLAFLKSKDNFSSIQDNIFTIGVDGGNYLTVARIENGNSTVYTSNLFQQYTANSDLNCVIRIENGVVTLKLNNLSYTSTPITGLKYVGVRNWNNAKTVTYTDFIVKPLSKPLELSCDNLILSYVDSDTATITATYIGGDGYDVKLYREFDDSLIATMTDEGDGTYTYEYTSSGIGDFEVYAKIGNYTSETYLIEDCNKYDPTEYTSTQNTNIALPSDNFEISAEIWSNNKDSYPQIYFGTELNVDNVAFGHIASHNGNIYHGAEFKKNNARLTLLETSSTRSANTYYPITLQKQGSNYSIICGNETLTYSNNTITIEKLFLIYIPNGKIKDLKVKPL